jgi:hypothetical protein
MTTIIDLSAQTEELTQRQRWSHYFVLIFAVIGLLIGINLRDSTLNARISYSDLEAGIRASYPNRWLVDTSGEYIFRVSNVVQTGFSTSIAVDLQPISISTTSRNFLDSISLNRSQTLTGYRILEIDNLYALPDGRMATAMSYTFVTTETNPFLNAVPVIVEGLDIIDLREGQALIVSFLSDASYFDQNLVILEQFLVDLRY